MNKVIMKKYRDEQKWIETTLQDAIDHLAVYWKEETIESMLLDEGLTLWNPFAEYKAVFISE